MDEKKRKPAMLIPTIVMVALALGLVALGALKGKGQHVSGLKAAYGMTLENAVIILAAFVVAGMAQAMVSQETLTRWLGSESGLRGLLVGTVAGGFWPGPPYANLPIVAQMLKAGAGVGTLVAFLTAWSLWALPRLPVDVGFVGWRFTLIRIAATFFFPPIAGLVAQAIARVWR